MSMLNYLDLLPKWIEQSPFHIHLDEILLFHLLYRHQNINKFNSNNSKKIYKYLETNLNEYIL
jgi:hypothetical protein